MAGREKAFFMGQWHVERFDLLDDVARIDVRPSLPGNEGKPAGSFVLPKAMADDLTAELIYNLLERAGLIRSFEA